MIAANRACEDCLRRTWLIARLAAHLERVRGRIGALLGLPDEVLIDAVGGDQRSVVSGELGRFDAVEARRAAIEAGVKMICRCDGSYPARLADLPAPPAVVHVAGSLERFLELAESDPVAIVGSRRPSPYGLQIAHSLGRGLGAGGICVVSGMAFGVDAAAHAGALGGGGGTLAVLPGQADRPYPAAKRVLHGQIRTRGAAVSELPPGSQIWKWTFPARNRIIAALSALTVVVEAGARSGALLTAAIARDLGRPVGAVPGMVTSPLASGPNRLLARGAKVVRGPQDVLDAVFGEGVREAVAEQRPELPPELRRLVAAIAEGRDTAEALARADLGPEQGLAALAELELAGYVRREQGGRFIVVT
jgi:DNA processing protein